MKRKITEKLLAWKNNSERKPLILNGARQVGKTYILKEFGEQNYQNTVYINLEANLAIANFFAENISPLKIIQFLEVSFETKILPEKTLIILDEIQVSERALTSLKYFCEEANQYHVVAAGSLLGVAVNRQKYSFPVGKVETFTLYHLDFEEFLWVNNKNKLCQLITECFNNNVPLPEELHQQAITLYKNYLIVGGMPAVVKSFLDKGNFSEVNNIQNSILSDYIADMAKYAGATESVRIRSAYNSIPNQLAKDNKKFQYKVVQKGGTATMFGSAIDWLTFAGIVIKCQKTTQGVEPVAVHTDLSSFKLYMADVGLLTMKSGLAQQTILSNLPINNTFLGALTENYVAGALHAKGYPLYYWESSSIAEVDFVLQKDNLVIPFEVKSNVNVRSKSLSVFIKNYSPKYSVRISQKNFGFENNIKSVPLYAVFCI
jgi:uncharacterized protein